MKKKTIKTERMNSILWDSSRIVDWTQGGSSYDLDGIFLRGKSSYLAYHFDAAIQSSDKKYVFVYERLGTKGVLLKNGELLRELNRSFYQAATFEYPVTFYTNKNGVTYIIHCPQVYNRLEIEIAETGEIVTDSVDRDPDDFFHSRLEVSPSGRFLLSKGWIWHPMDYICAYDLEKCIANPKLLDSIELAPSLKGEHDFSTGTFLENDLAVLGSYGCDTRNTTDSFVVLWDISNNRIVQKIRVDGEIGNFVGIVRNQIVDSYKLLKLIDLKTGSISIVDDQTPFSSQRSPIVCSADLTPSIVYDKELETVAALRSGSIDFFQLT